MFVLKVLGGAALERGGVPVTGRAVHRRRLALLALLASARGRMVRRERLIGYLWPDHPGDAARHLLSESLYILRKAVGEDTFVTAGDELALDPAVVRSDVADFMAALEADDPAAAVAAYGGPFLDGFYVADAPEFERWAEEERDRLARAYARALEQMAEAREAEGDPLGAAEWWKRLARHDPFSSRIALRTMQALEAGGERAAAIRHATSHAALMRAEMDAEPDAAVEELARRLREAPRPAEPAPAFAPAASGTAAAATAVQAPPAQAEPAVVPAAPQAAPRTEPVPVRRPFVPGPRWLAPGVALAVALLVAVGILVSRRGASAEGLDESVYLVLPFAQRGTSAVTPDQAELLLHDALSRWTDLRLVDAQRARDLVARNGPPENLREARSIAREAGAGKLVWGEITPLGDSVVVRAALYDLTRGGDAVQAGTIRVGRDLRGVSERFGTLASSLLGRSGGDVGGATGTTSLAAWQAYGRGRVAMSRWELGVARTELQRAVSLDPGYAAAHLWLAQAIAWEGAWSEQEWRENAARALADSARLSSRERALAGALVSLGEDRYPEACRLYEGLVARDSSDFAAWFGVGECHRRDQMVLPDPSSPSGWRFRSSYHRAVQAYSRALRAVPSSHLAFRGAGFARLTELLRTQEGFLRAGHARASSGWMRFASYPSLNADTLAFIPWTMEDVARVRKETVPPTRRAAVARNRQVLRSILVDWARAFPESPDAHEALSRGLEGLGEIREVAEGQPSAFSALARARAQTTDPEAQLRMSIAQVRLYVRVGEFGRARLLADSTLRRWRAPGRRDALLLAPLAVLTGRVEQARVLSRASAAGAHFATARGQPVEVPLPLAQAHADALLYAGLGLEPEASEAESALVRLAEAWIEEGMRPLVHSAVLNAPRRLSFPGNEARVRQLPLQVPDFVVEIQQSLAAGDTAEARVLLAGLLDRRGARQPGDLTTDFAYTEAELHLALGDTAGALEELDRSLLALQAVPLTVLDRIEETAGLLRAMRLRAQLAAARGDTRTAERWRGALATLWAGGDPRLRRTVR
jgi:DNA-binding SARP family transcriptional activator